MDPDGWQARPCQTCFTYGRLPHVMNSAIHPKYFPQATIRCACGAVHTFGSTVEAMTVELCSNCHPFYTGKQKLVDTAGRVDRYKRLASKRTRPKKS